MATPTVGAGKTGGTSPLAGGSGPTGGQTGTTGSPAPSRTSALDAAGGMNLDSIKADSGPKEVDMTGDIGASRSVDGNQQAIASQKKQGEESTKAAGENKTADGLQTAGGIVAGVGGVLAACLGPFFWVGLIVTAVGGIMAAVGSGMKSTAQQTAQTEKGAQEERTASLEENMGQPRENMINDQLAAKAEGNGLEGGSSTASGRAAATLEGGRSVPA